MQMPSSFEIADRIDDLGLNPRDPRTRARAVKAILAERQPSPDQPKGTVLSRSTVAIADGHLEITVTHHPSEGTAPA